MSNEPPEQNRPYFLEEPYPSNLNAWKRATELSGVIQKRLADLPLEPFERVIWDELQPGEYDEWRRRKVERILQAELVLGRHAIYARCLGDPAEAVEAIHPDYLVDVELDFARNAADGEGSELIDVRVLLDAEQDTQTGAASGKPRLKARPGRPSQRQKIEPSIETCAAPKDWFGRPPRDRFSAYRAHIKGKFDVDPHANPGFEDKTLEKYETLYRQKHGR